MLKVLLVGCGSLGTAIAMNLFEAGHEVIGVRKSSKPLPNGLKTIQADVTMSSQFEALNLIKPQVIIYCIAANAQSDESYYLHYVAGLKHVLESQQDNTLLERVFFVSSTRVYGKVTQDIVDEDSPTIANDFGGERLLQAEQLLSQLKCEHTVLRLSGIYGPGRLYLLNMAKDMSRWPELNHWSNRIHQQDAAAFISFLVNSHEKKLQLDSCYLVTDDMPTQQYEVLLWIAKQLNQNVGNIAVPPVGGGKRLSNKRMRDTGFLLTYPTYQQGYMELLESE
jgi:nucleoside-diphosphate-sugar epimerase